MRSSWTKLKNAFDWNTLFSAEIRPEDALGRETAEAYNEWRRNFIRERLHVLYYLGFIANPAFLALDYLQHRESLIPLFITRVVLQLGLLSGFLLLKYGPKSIPPNWFVMLWVVVANLCVTQMTVILGGFASQYYNGLNLVYLTAAVIVPVSWPSHLAGQFVTLSSYYVNNFLGVQPNVNAAIENSFFLIWTSVALLFSVSLYERLQRAEFDARVSEQHARRELEASHNKLLELDRLKTEFFANISHELRTPLTLSLGAFKTLMRASLSPNVQQHVEVGLRNTSRLLFLINELLDLAKFDSGRATPQKRCLNFAALIRGVVTNFDSSQPRRIHLTGVSEPVVLEADPRQMKKVLFNLFSNAFKFSDPERGQVWVRLTVRDTKVDLEIEDNGIGIPPDQVARIFDRFTQVEGSATRRYEGSGIGLALVKEIVTIHGGTIAVESHPGRGSTFTITLPKTTSGISSIEALEDEDDVTMLPARGGSVLDAASPTDSSVDESSPLLVVADDNADMRAYLHRVLGRHYRVRLANDGAEALERVQADHPELVVTDAMMPRMSGYDLLKAIRADQALRSIPVIFLTARAGTEARVESLEAGADDYLAKPFDEHELLARVGNLIRTRAQERELVRLQKEKLARFLPTQLADMILAGDKEEFLKGHRRDITVVFIDLRGFTAFAEMAAPEDLMTMLREYQAVMGKIIAQHGGTLERFAGDSMMVFFNDPVPVPDHVEQAVRMALAMRENVAELCEKWSKRDIDLGAGIGIATGYATLGLIGYDERKDYAAIGPVTNLAARLCHEAQHGQILVPERVIHLVAEKVQAEPVGSLNLKGFQRPVAAFNITGVR